MSVSAEVGERATVADGRPPRTPRGSEQRFTLKIDNKPVGPVIDQLARQLKLQVQWDPAIAADDRNQLISCEVRDADLDKLLEAVLTPARLSFSRDDKSVTIERVGTSP